MPKFHCALTAKPMLLNVAVNDFELTSLCFSRCLVFGSLLASSVPKLEELRWPKEITENYHLLGI